MKRKGAEGVSAVHRISAAANEDFVGGADVRETPAERSAGWDPYEVWRTRVRTPFRARRERERKPLR